MLLNCDLGCCCLLCPLLGLAAVVCYIVVPRKYEIFCRFKLGREEEKVVLRKVSVGMYTHTCRCLGSENGTLTVVIFAGVSLLL